MRKKHREITDIWFRNSLKLGYWAFLRSDIDVTIMIRKGSPELFFSLLKTHDRIKKILPVMGEAVFLDESKKADLIELMNPLELRRDPDLMKMAPLLKVPDLSDKAVFLHKFIISNWDKRHLPQRPSKISYTLNEVFPNKSLSSTLEDLPNLLAILLGEKEDFLREYKYFLENSGDAEAIKDGPIHETTYVLFYNKICYLPLNKTISPVSASIMSKVIAWELWGCFTNQSVDNKEQIKKHINFLFEQSKNHLNHEDFQFLKEKASLIGLS